MLKNIFCGAALTMPCLIGRPGILPAFSLNDEIDKIERKAMASVAEDFMRNFDAPALP